MKTALIAVGLALLAPAAALAQTGEAPAATRVDAHYTLDTPIKDLIVDPAAKAVLDKDLPGMSSDANLPKFEDKSLRQLQPMTGGQLTDDLLKQVATDLAAIAGGGDAAADTAPADNDAAASSDAPAPDATAPADGSAASNHSAPTTPVGDPQAPTGR